MKFGLLMKFGPHVIFHGYIYEIEASMEYSPLQKFLFFFISTTIVLFKNFMLYLHVVLKIFILTRG